MRFQDRMTVVNTTVDTWQVWPANYGYKKTIESVKAQFREKG